MRPMNLVFAALIVALLFPTFTSRSGEADRVRPLRPATTEQVRFFEGQVRPILKAAPFEVPWGRSQRCAGGCGSIVGKP